MELNNEQRKALKGLERAFKKCADLGMCFYGMEDGLITLPRQETEEEWTGTLKMTGDNIMQEGITVKTYNSYKDSGAY